MRRCGPRLGLALVVAFGAGAGCGGQSGSVDDFGAPGLLRVGARRGTALVAGCTPGDGGGKALASAPVRALVSDVVLACFDLDAAGSLVTIDGSPHATFVTAAGELAALGYHVKAGVTLGASTPLLAKSATRDAFVAAIRDLAPAGDGLELDVRGVPASARDLVTELVTDVGAAVRPGRTLGVLVPSYLPSPGVWSGAGAGVDLASVAPHVDRVRLMTVDYSLGSGPGPNVDPSWAFASATRALDEVGATALDVAVPLYGVRSPVVGSGGEVVSYAQAQALAQAAGRGAWRALGGELSVRLPPDAPHAEPTDIWFEDARSTLLVLAAWPSPTLRADVGILFDGLGQEDPGLWPALQEAER